ncbi:hypothetical protein PABG_11467 [Paracoccidioides brasiliensis Pb03]|uniref:Uncharacterized protein n=1 Tax=Paracoccidioides brasiliensis TaxID=121759 RepID=A0A1D2JDX4_PARBR|nr:hypothetical protein PABG_11467 [Paracoccidioides brasiliensis Pb03]ODH27605.1 hypothetical protein ACO22_04140 [Paracoccidioides brasiliensis]
MQVRVCGRNQTSSAFTVTTIQTRRKTKQSNPRKAVAVDAIQKSEVSEQEYKTVTDRIEQQKR